MQLHNVAIDVIVMWSVEHSWLSVKVRSQQNSNIK